MPLTPADTIAIHELIGLHGHLVDSGELNRLDELFTVDVVYDVTALGQAAIHGIDDFRAVVTAFVDDTSNPWGHHVTNILVTDDGDGRALVRSKGFGVVRDGRVSSVVYFDQVVRTDRGWRIGSREVRPSTG